MQRIKKGDTVEVIAGKDKGQRGAVLRVLPKAERVVVERINIVKKHQKRQQAGNQQLQPGIIEFEAPLNLSNVMLVCTQCQARTRVNFRTNEEGRKVRTFKKCHADID
jgi:large subunit ribosomal protein L24